jgi:small subunit ribosomal protein S6
VTAPSPMMKEEKSKSMMPADAAPAEAAPAEVAAA